MNINYTLSPAQDALVIAERKRHNRKNPTDQRTNQQILDAQLTFWFAKWLERSTSDDASDYQEALRAASPATQDQIKTLLGL